MLPFEDANVQTVRHDWSNVAGPRALAYECSEAPVSVIIGPTGGGKTQASARKILRVALSQHPSPRDGVRKARITCVAPSYPLLWDTAIASYRKVYPTDGPGKWGKWSGTRGYAADHVFDLELADPTNPRAVQKLHIEVAFRSLPENMDLEEFMRGRETTAWWLPEMDQLPSEDVLSLCYNRRGRYPEAEDRPLPAPTLRQPYSGVFGDANAPIEGGWFHKRFYIDKRPGDRVFRQPAYDEPGAENLHNLARINPNYYADLAANMSDYDIARLLRCKPGWSRNGRPVHDRFDATTMVTHGRIEALSDVLLEIGVDSGNTLWGAAVFGQRVMGGQRALREIAKRDQQTDVKELGEEIRRVKDTEFAHVKHAIITVDPSARAKTAMDRQISYAQQLQVHSGIKVRLAPSNDPGKRMGAVNNVLKRLGGYVISGEGCPLLIEALSGGYKYLKRQGREGQWSDVPDKSHPFSDIAEAEQYRLLGSEGLGAVEGGLIPPRQRRAHSGRRVILQD